jgi:hypothetical protein
MRLLFCLFFLGLFLTGRTQPPKEAAFKSSHIIYKGIFGYNTIPKSAQITFSTFEDSTLITFSTRKKVTVFKLTAPHSTDKIDDKIYQRYFARDLFSKRIYVITIGYNEQIKIIGVSVESEDHIMLFEILPELIL